jgi:hypothetical protein
MQILGSMRGKGTPSKLPYINTDCFYDFGASNWQVIRPSFLFFLNKFMPMVNQTLQLAEVGVAVGVNAALMFQAFDRTFIYLIDDCASLPNGPTDLLKITEPFKERRRFIQKHSVQAAKDFKDEFFDYVYIDAAHDYNNVLADLNAWYPKVKYGGMLAGHDWWLEDVRKAVLEFMKEHPQRLYCVQNCLEGDINTDIDKERMQQGQDWWFIKMKLALIPAEKK